MTIKRVHTLFTIKRCFFVLFALLLAACSLEKKSTFNRHMQNLTAHFNILFNARELINQKQEAYAAGFVDSYTELLSVYQDTAAITGEDKDIEAAISKANYIISFKEQSKYLGDAYLIIGKANYLKQNYFNAVEFFNYVLRSYGNKPDLTQESLVWKARAQMRLNQQAAAKATLDSAVQNINPKKGITGDVYATQLQYDIYQQEYAHAEEMAKQAIAHIDNSRMRMRLTFILGQLQELNQKPADAIASYTRVVRSNVAFEMAFNADLNRIRIEDMRDGVKISRIERLRRLLRNQNNKEFTDQIYYQIGQLYYNDKEIDKALEHYRLSTRYSEKNLNQKGLSYLRMADIYFKDRADYVNAKKYYDSTLANLSTTYPGYLSIAKKNDNLELLTGNLSIIAKEDTLQMLARLDEGARTTKITEKVNRQAAQVQVTQQAPTGKSSRSGPLDAMNVADPQASTPTGSNFYFYNNAAVSSGFSIFKRKWGNRRLEDNWRRSQRNNADLAINNIQPTDGVAAPGQAQQAQLNTATNSYRQQLEQSIPLTPDKLLASNLRIYNAYLDIANFYRDVLEDSKEAIATYELLLKRFPDNPNLASIYYSLYRLYTPINQTKAEYYRNKLLTDYAATPYAKIILDPEYARRSNDADAEFNALYNQVYDLYMQRKYADVMQQVDMLMQQYPQNRLAPQLYYLRALARGRQVKLAPFKADLLQIITQYPTDQLITPLVGQHLLFIEANNNEMAARPFAIIDSDPNYIPFAPEEVGPMVSQFAEVADKKVERPKDLAAQKPAGITAAPATIKPGLINRPADSVAIKQPEQAIVNQPVAEQPVVTEPVKPKKDYPFNESDNTNYYFVVNVSTSTTNLSSSRFGIGQFNRSRYTGSPIRHFLKNVGGNQLIYVGRFNNLDEAKDYGRKIIPLMPQIMKVPQDKYSFFIITQQNLDKLADKKLLDTYIEYYGDNF